MAWFRASSRTAVLAFALCPIAAGAAGKDGGSPGKAVYDLYCASCHGATGKGDGEESMYLTPTPRDFTKGVLDKRSDDFLASVILKGGEANGLSKSMPPFSKLTSAEVKNVIAYLRVLGKGGAGPPGK